MHVEEERERTEAAHDVLRRVGPVDAHDEELRPALRDQPLLVVRGHDDRDGLPLEHPAVRLQRGSAGDP